MKRATRDRLVERCQWHGTRRVVVKLCEACKYPMGYFFVCNQLYFDPGCHCDDRDPYVLPFSHLQKYLAKHPDALDAVMEN